MKIGVGVEGPSDRVFWHEFLHKRFGGIQFDVRTMGSKETLIRQTPRLLEAFRSLQYTAGFILVDRERDPCFPAVLERQFGQNSSPRKIGFARMMAPQFDPEVARQHSASFDYFWTRLTTNLAS